MTPTIKVIGNRIVMDADFGHASIPLDDDVKAQWASWKARYQAVAAAPDANQLRLIGTELLTWIDRSGWARKWLDAPGPRQLEIAGDASITDDQFRLMDLPWEALADRNGFLALDTIQPFEVWRRAGQPAEPGSPEHRDLSLLFMASSPRNVTPELDFEAEEVAILNATDGFELGLFVEESGCPQELRERTLHRELFDAFHFSSHGEVLDEETANRFASEGARAGPNLLMETREGDRLFVPPTKLAEIWEGTPPQLVFLSACKTSVQDAETHDTYASELARAVPAVLGWGGAVLDPDATRFAASFYRELAGFQDVPGACAKARRDLLSETNDANERGAHWHLARLWLGPHGGGPLCAREGATRELPKNAGYKSFLDNRRNRGKVAGPLTFVGRRRLTQDILKTLRRPDCIGAVILGMGNLGKSSLAARVANRLPTLTNIVVVDDYDARSILTILLDALPPGVRDSINERWADAVDGDPSRLALAVEDLLESHYRQNPILLIIDDLEQVLADPQKGEERCALKADHGASDTIVAVLEAFRKSRGRSRLLFTSRYDFSAFGADGTDLARSLSFFNLEPFSPGEQRKQWRAELNVRLRSDDTTIRRAAAHAIGHEDYAALQTRAIAIANGNPGLQDLFTRPLLSADFEPVRAALSAMTTYLNNPEVIPEEDNAAFEFFRRNTFEKYQAALTPTEAGFLKAASVFDEVVWPEDVAGPAAAALRRYQSTPAPVSSEALAAVGEAAGIGDVERARRRVTGLGLLDVYSERHTGRTDNEYLVNQFARPLIPKLTAGERAVFAKAALPALEADWTDGDGAWPEDHRSVEALRLAFLAESTEA